MTGYHISIGYNSGAPISAWEFLLESVEHISAAPEYIVREVRRETLNWTEEELRPFAARYKAKDDDTLTIIQPTEGANGQVMQLASGGGESRLIKEAVRRAFCRLVMLEMHKMRIEVNVTVA